LKSRNFIQHFIVVFQVMIFSCLDSISQEVPHPVSNTGIYEFIDELANNQIISINSAIKPYSRLFIANCLKDAEEKMEQLNPRQQKELNFYMMDFRKEFKYERENGSKGQWLRGSKAKRRWDMFYYKDSLFSLTANPILGGEVFNNSDGTATYWRNGLEARGYVGKWGFYASLRDNHEKPLLGLPEYLTKREGGHLKGSTDWSEMQGGVTYSWKWGYTGIVKENLQWGDNYNGANIFGGRNPSFVMLKLHLKPVKWFDFNYYHGWLNSQVVDSARSYWVTNSYGIDYREVYHQKFIAANMFTFTPLKNLNISAGNSIVYCDLGVHPAYLIPVIFYKSVDHSVNSGIDNMNSQMFFDISSRQIKHVHVYASLFIDELSVERIKKDDEWNFVSWKAGFRITDLPVQNLSFTTEFTYTYPLTYMHYVPTLTFESNNFNLGHYMKDNSREWYAGLNYRPLRALNINLFFLDAIRGPDYTELGTNRVGNPPLSSVEWHNTTVGLKASYQVINDLYMWISYAHSDVSGDVRWSPEYFYGTKNTINLAMSFGF
jgi:hypothetical protein